MAAPSSPTPEDVFDLFVSLSGGDQQAFLRLLGRSAIAEVPFEIAHELSPPELERFSEMIHQELAWQSFPVFTQEARRLAREQPQIADEEFDKLLNERVGERMALYDQKISELERAKLKKKRDRKSDPEIVRRNVEICDRRKQDRKKWSIGKLAKTYKLSHRGITLVLRDEPKWRRLNQQNAQ